MKKFHLILLLLLIIAFSILAYVIHQNDASFDFVAMLIANGMMAVLSFMSYSMIANSLKLKGGDALYRSKITSTMMKFAVIIGCVVVYYVSLDHKIHKPTVFFFLGLYIAYNFAETYVLSKMAREKAKKQN